MKSRVLDLLGVPAYHPEGFSRVGRQTRLFEGGGAEIYSSDNSVAAPPPPPLSYANFTRFNNLIAPSAANTPTSEQWGRILGGEDMLIGDTYYGAEREGARADIDNWSEGTLTGRVSRTPAGSNQYQMLGPDGVETFTGRESKGFFGDFFRDLGDMVTETPILQMASIIPSPIQPFAAAANAIINKDPLAAIAAAAGAGVFTDVANAARVASAIDRGDILGAVTPGLSLAGVSDIGGFSAKDISDAARGIGALQSGNPLALAGIASSYLPGPTMPGAGTSEDIQEGFFEPGGPGFMPTEFLDDAEVQRELTSLLGRYPAPPPPSDWFLGENIMSGVPEWDMAAVNAGLPIGNLEQDFSVAQTKEGPQIVDSAGNVGNFVNGEFVVDTGVTPNLSYAATSAPATGKAPGKAPAAPTPAPAKTPAGVDPMWAFLFGAMMTPQEQKQQEEQMVSARAVPSPFGMDLLL